MASRVFFSFDYQDVVDFRANVVRNHWLTKPNREAAGFFDASLWETARKVGNVAVKRLINEALDGTSVTCVLIGTHTYARPWVRYEILKSFRKGNSQFGVHINGIKGRDKNTKILGPDPFASLGVSYSSDGLTGTLWEFTNGRWMEYKEIGGTSTFSTRVGERHRGKGFQLAAWYPTYKWNADNGFANFAKWVG